MALRAEKACSNAQRVAEHLSGKGLPAVYYPGLPSHPDHETARGQFDGRFGTIVTVTLPGGTAAATAFIKAARNIPFSPSLGDLGATLSHPESTSHRKLSPRRREELGIDGGAIRLSMGIESPEAIIAAIEEGLAALSE